VRAFVTFLFKNPNDSSRAEGLGATSIFAVFVSSLPEFDIN